MIRTHLNEDCKNGELNLMAFTKLVNDMRDNDFLNEAQNEIMLANERISMLEAALDELEDPLEQLGSHCEH